MRRLSDFLAHALGVFRSKAANLTERIFFGKNSSQKKKSMTIIVLPNDSSRARQINIPMRLYRALRYSAVPVCLLFTFILLDYGNMLVRVSDVGRLKRENTSQKIELRSLSVKINDLETKLSKLELFDKKLRIIANIEKPASIGEGGLGMGGPSPSDDPFLSLEDKKGELAERMRSELIQLEVGVENQERSFTELQEFLLKQSSVLASTPSVWPTRGWVTSTYGMRRDPFTGHLQMHKGLDIANRPGTLVSAPAEGIVTRATMHSHFGKTVEISHGYGIKTTYGHLSEIYVKVGQRVKRGAKIAGVGSTGRSTGPHLHYEVSLNGVSVDPNKYILN